MLIPLAFRGRTPVFPSLDSNGLPQSQTAATMSCDPFDPAADSALAALAPGLVLAGRFELIGFAGKGGMGVVWHARDRSLEQDVAMKFIPSLVASDSMSTNELRREAKRARDLTHPYICRVHDYAEDLERGLAWISMEYLPGENLTRRLRAQPRGFFEVAEIQKWVGQLCDALTYAHERAGLVHRDLKPSNLLLDSRGDVKVSDFGIAQTICESVTRLTGTMCPTGSSGSGTPLYMSPQQARGDRARATDDLYSLGATLFELLTGRAPFFAGDINYQRQHVPAPTVLDRRRELHRVELPVPEAWEITIQRLLAKYPEHRPQSAREVAEVLSASAVPTGGVGAPATSKSMAKPGDTQAPTTAKPSPAASATNFLLSKTARAGGATTQVPSVLLAKSAPPGAGAGLLVRSQLPPPGTLPEPGQRHTPVAREGKALWLRVCLWAAAALFLFLMIAGAFALGFYLLGQGPPQ
jgi:serine/threonine protein kinase